METVKLEKQEGKHLKGVLNYFMQVDDFRMVNKCSHKLSDILFTGLLTCLSNGKDYEDMVLFSKTHLLLLKSYIELPNGIP